MNPLVVLRVGYMERYDGPDTITGGGGYVLENGVGGEVFNFKPSRGKCYGYAMSTKFAGLNLKKVDSSKTWLSGEGLTGVDVVFIAVKPKVGQVVVGWYRNATIFHKQYYKRRGTISGMSEPSLYFLCSTQAKSAHLLNEDNRIFEVPSAPAGNPGFPGQSNVWYPTDNVDNAKVKLFIKRLRKYIDETSGTSLPPDDTGMSGGKGRKGGGSRTPDHAHNVEVELAAVNAVWTHYKNMGYNVESVESENLGWDLYAHKGKETLHIEVKGVSNAVIYFEMTPNEYKKLQEYSSRFRVCVVCDALTIPKVYELSPEKVDYGWRLVSVDKLVSVSLRERIAAVGAEILEKRARHTSP